MGSDGLEIERKYLLAARRRTRTWRRSVRGRRGSSRSTCCRPTGGCGGSGASRSAGHSRHVLTRKRDRSGIVREEIEVDVSPEEYGRLVAEGDPARRVIRKTRHLIPSGRVPQGRLPASRPGLVLLEVELRGTRTRCRSPGHARGARRPRGEHRAGVCQLPAGPARHPGGRVCGRRRCDPAVPRSEPSPPQLCRLRRRRHPEARSHSMPPDPSRPRPRGRPRRRRPRTSPRRRPRGRGAATTTRPPPPARACARGRPSSSSRSSTPRRKRARAALPRGRGDKGGPARRDDDAVSEPLRRRETRPTGSTGPPPPGPASRKGPRPTSSGTAPGGA